jgi:hypothetical protein
MKFLKIEGSIPPPVPPAEWIIGGNLSASSLNISCNDIFRTDDKLMMAHCQ